MTRIVILQTGYGDRFLLRKRGHGPTRLLIKNGIKFEFRAIGKLQRFERQWLFHPHYWECDPLAGKTSIAVALLAVEQFLLEPRTVIFRERRDLWTNIQRKERK